MLVFVDLVSDKFNSLASAARMLASLGIFCRTHTISHVSKDSYGTARSLLNIIYTYLYIYIYQGSCKLPIVHGIKQCKCMVILRDFPCSSFIVWVGVTMIRAYMVQDSVEENFCQMHMEHCKRTPTYPWSICQASPFTPE